MHIFIYIYILLPVDICSAMNKCRYSLMKATFSIFNPFLNSSDLSNRCDIDEFFYLYIYTPIFTNQNILRVNH